jgi:hypothetical protein
MFPAIAGESGRISPAVGAQEPPDRVMVRLAVVASSSRCSLGRTSEVSVHGPKVAKA